MGFLLEQVNKVLFPFLFKEKILFFSSRVALKQCLQSARTLWKTALLFPPVRGGREEIPS